MTLSLIAVERFRNVGGHFGHKWSDWRSRVISSKFFAHTRGGYLVFNLEAGLFFFQQALLVVKNMSRRGSIIFYIDNGKVSKTAIPNAAAFASVSYISNLWVGGILTNFREVVYKVVRRDNFVRFKKKKNYVRGLHRLDFVPEIVLLSSEVNSPFALREANILNIPAIAVVDSNIKLIESPYRIIMNDDSHLVLKTLFFLFSSGVWIGRADFSARYLGVLTAYLHYSSSKISDYVKLIGADLISSWLSVCDVNLFDYDEDENGDFLEPDRFSIFSKLVDVVGLEPTFSFTGSGF